MVIFKNVFRSDINLAHKKREAGEHKCILGPSLCCDVPFCTLPRVVLWRNRQFALTTTPIIRNPLLNVKDGFEVLKIIKPQRQNLIKNDDTPCF
jgi:hypothetical protein